MTSTSAIFAINDYAILSVANSNRDGTGTIYKVIEGHPSFQGLIIRSVTIKASQQTSAGIIRFYISDANKSPQTYQLIKEARIPQTTPSATVAAFTKSVRFPIEGLRLEPGWGLYASSEIADDIIVIGEGVLWLNNDPDTLQLRKSKAFNDSVKIDVANPNLDGSGTTYELPIRNLDISNGGLVRSITIKAEDSTSQGMVRFFVSPDLGVTKVLLKEVRIPSVDPCNNYPTFSKVVGFPLLNFRISNEWQLYASTENAEAFYITIEGSTWENETSTPIGGAV